MGNKNSTKNSWHGDLAGMFKDRNNPTDLKEGLIGVVVGLSPLSVHIENGQATLREGEELILSEWFQKRWDINKTKALSLGVQNELQGARSVVEFHSYTGAPCNMPNAIMPLANAIEKINTELLQLKLDLKLKDKVILLPSDMRDKYFLIDKVKDDSNY